MKLRCNGRTALPIAGSRACSSWTDWVGGHHPMLRRAGWAIQTDADGELVAAAFGAVPRDECPAQTSRDGDGFAVAMLAVVEEECCVLCIYCRGTLDTLAMPRGHLGAHLWTQVPAAFDVLLARKTKVDACQGEVERGATMEWERRGNGHPDRSAKARARLHGLSENVISRLSENVISRYHKCASLARQAAQRASEQVILQRDSGLEDASVIPRRTDASAARRLGCQGAATRGGLHLNLQALLDAAPAQASGPTALGNTAHVLRIADVPTTDVAKLSLALLVVPTHGAVCGPSSARAQVARRETVLRGSAPAGPRLVSLAAACLSSGQHPFSPAFLYRLGSSGRALWNGGRQASRRRRSWPLLVTALTRPPGAAPSEARATAPL